MNGHLLRCRSASGAHVFVGAYCNTPLQVRFSLRLASGALLRDLQGTGSIGTRALGARRFLNGLNWRNTQTRS